MIAIPRPAIRACATVFRRAAGRTDDPPVTLTAAAHDVSLRCLAAGTTITYAGPVKRDRGELTVRLSVLERLAAPGRDDVVFRPKDTTHVEVVERRSVAMTVERVTKAVPLPPAAKSLVSPGDGFVAALATAAGTTGVTTRFALDKILLRCARGEIVSTDGTVLLAHCGFRLPGDKDVLIPVCPSFGVPEVRNQKEVQVGLAEGHLVVKAGPWSVAIPEAKGRFPDVESVVPKSGTAVATVELHEDALDVIKAKVPGLPVTDTHTRPVALDVDPFGVFVTAGNERLELPGCRVTGAAVRVEMERRHLVRASKLDFKTFCLSAPGKPVLAAEGNRRLVWASLAGNPESGRVSPRGQRPAPARPAPQPANTRVPCVGDESLGGLFGGFRMLVDAIRKGRTAEVVDELPDRG
jgi:hypothetical protein